jgi:hypothetical protein
MGNPETPNRHTDSSDNPGSWGKAGDLSRKDPEALEKMNGREGGGDSGGGAYPNPHTGKGGSDREGYMGHGGQTGMPYEGPSNPNSPTEKTKPGKSED